MHKTKDAYKVLQFPRTLLPFGRVCVSLLHTSEPLTVPKLLSHCTLTCRLQTALVRVFVASVVLRSFLTARQLVRVHFADARHEPVAARQRVQSFQRSYGRVEHTHRARDKLILAAAVEELFDRYHTVPVGVHLLWGFVSVCVCVKINIRYRVLPIVFPPSTLTWKMVSTLFLMLTSSVPPSSRAPISS